MKIPWMRIQGAIHQSKFSHRAVFVAILVACIVPGILYESYIHPLTILSGLPSAGFGALSVCCMQRLLSG